MGNEDQVPSIDELKEEGQKCIALGAMQSMETGKPVGPVDAAVGLGVYNPQLRWL